MYGGKTYVDEDEPFKILIRFSEQRAIGPVDARVAVVYLRAFRVFDLRWRVLAHAFDGETLEGGEHVGAGFDGVGWADDVRVWVADVGVRVWVLEGGLVRVDGPGGDVDLGRYYH